MSRGVSDARKGRRQFRGRRRDSIVSDALEAIIGAIYLDGGLECARTFIIRHVLNDIQHKQLFYDSKTILQEIVQGNMQGEIVYQLLGEDGPDHDKDIYNRGTGERPDAGHR